jgi:hypothetical protein
MTYDVRRVVLGGGVSNAGAAFLAPIERALDEMRAASELAREILPEDAAIVLPAGSDAGAWGAVVLARSATMVAADDAFQPDEEPGLATAAAKGSHR